MKDIFLSKIGLEISNVRFEVVGFFKIELVTDEISVDLSINHLELDVIEDLTHWQKNAQKFLNNCKIIRGKSLFSVKAV